jgi:hypothetical protein
MDGVLMVVLDIQETAHMAVVAVEVLVETEEIHLVLLEVLVERELHILLRALLHIMLVVEVELVEVHLEQVLLAMVVVELVVLVHRQLLMLLMELTLPVAVEVVQEMLD